MTTQQAIDIAKTQAFMGKVMADNASTAATVMASIGDRLGLFKALAEVPATSTELAKRAHINERYAREWLSEMASVGYLELEPTSQRFTLPPEHVPVLAQERGSFLPWRGLRAVDGRDRAIQPATPGFPTWWWCANGSL